jgi:hypothetical protein
MQKPEYRSLGRLKRWVLGKDLRVWPRPDRRAALTGVIFWSSQQLIDLSPRKMTCGADWNRIYIYFIRKKSPTVPQDHVLSSLCRKKYEKEVNRRVTVGSAIVDAPESPGSNAPGDRAESVQDGFSSPPATIGLKPDRRSADKGDADTHENRGDLRRRTVLCRPSWKGKSR